MQRESTADAPGDFIAIPVDPPVLRFHTSAPEQFQQLLQDHIFVACLDGCTIRELLCEQLHVCGDYTQKRIQTVFLNGHPVDDIDSARVAAGDTVALSSAMPGLMGAMMRTNSPFKQMRDTISLAQQDTEENPGQPCLVRMRLFNFLAKELAGLFLDNGFYTETDVFARFHAQQSPEMLDVRDNDDNPIPLPWSRPIDAPLLFIQRTNPA